MKKKKRNKIMIGSLIAASSILMVACTNDDVKEVSKDGNSTTIVEKLQLTQDELAKAKTQQENRMVLLENFTNTTLSSNIYFVSLDNLLSESDTPLTALTKHDNDLQVALIQNSIDDLNKILANQLTEKEVKLVEQLIDVKNLEIELTNILFKALETGNGEKYVFTEELKKEYQDKRNLLVSFLLDSEKDITESVYLYHYPNISKDDITKHTEFMNLTRQLTDDKPTNALKDNLDNLLFNIVSFSDTEGINKDNTLKLLNNIEKAQNEAKLSDYYKENKFYKEFIDKYLLFNVKELKGSLEQDDFVTIYKKAQETYTSLYQDLQENEQHSYTYLYITSYYYELGKAKNDKEELKNSEIEKENKENSKEVKEETIVEEQQEESKE